MNELRWNRLRKKTMKTLDFKPQNQVNTLI